MMQKCEETVWTHRDPDRPGEVVPGHLRPCRNGARWRATDPFDENRSTLLCGSHANTGRWAGYADIKWEAIA